MNYPLARPHKQRLTKGCFYKKQNRFWLTFTPTPFQKAAAGEPRMNGPQLTRREATKTTPVQVWGFTNPSRGEKVYQMLKKTNWEKEGGRKIGIRSILIFAKDEAERRELRDIARSAKENNHFEITVTSNVVSVTVGERKRPMQLQDVQKTEIEFFKRFFANGVTVHTIDRDPKYVFGGIKIAAIETAPTTSAPLGGALKKLHKVLSRLAPKTR